MVVECLVIIAILVAVMALFWRVKRQQALAVAPLLILPAADLLMHIFIKDITAVIGVNIVLVYVLLVVVAVVISAVIIGALSVRMSSRGVKIGYFVMSVGFNIVLAIILINKLFSIYM